VGVPNCRSKVGFATIPGANPGSRISGPGSPNTSSRGVVRVRGDLKPKRDEEQIYLDRGLEMWYCSVEVHLVYHINKSLGGIPTEVIDHPGPTPVCEDRLD
jgi:hypothetical protein